MHARHLWRVAYVVRGQASSRLWWTTTGSRVPSGSWWNTVSTSSGSLDGLPNSSKMLGRMRTLSPAVVLSYQTHIQAGSVHYACPRFIHCLTFAAIAKDLRVTRLPRQKRPRVRMEPAMEPCWSFSFCIRSIAPNMQLIPPAIVAMYVTCSLPSSIHVLLNGCEGVKVRSGELPFLSEPQ